MFASGVLELYVTMNTSHTESYRFMMSSERIVINAAGYETDESLGDSEDLKKTGWFASLILVGVLALVVLCACRFFYRRYKLRRALIANENSGAL